MAVYNTIEELKDAITDTIYQNNAGLVTAEILQERLHDIIDTLNEISTSVAGMKAYLEAVNDLTGIKIGNDTAATQAWVAFQKGAANGIAELDSGGRVPTLQLPSYVDDVLEYANFAALPETGETSKIYVTLNTNLTYRWSGSAYVEISASLALGETSATAYRGDRGKSAYDHISNTNNPHGVTAGQAGALASGATAVAAAKLQTTNFSIEESSGSLVIKYGATVIATISSAGLLKTAGDVEFEQTL